MKRGEMKRLTTIFLLLMILGGLPSCNLPVPALSSRESQEVSQRYSTVSALLTKTALVTPSPLDPFQMGTEQPPVSVDTSHPEPTLTLAPSLFGNRQGTQTPQTLSGNTLEIPCDIAHPGRPIDITIPDDTRFYPGEYFSKTWRLVNAGSCVWTRDYAVVWFSGDNLGVSQTQYLTSGVEPGRAVEVTVEMVAPSKPGLYQSNWKLRNAQGQLFGIGPNGDSPFWARIVVVPLETQTATPTFPVATPTPVVYASGQISLLLDEAVDLDSGLLDMAEANDLALTRSQEKGLYIAPVNDARIVPFGPNAPGLLECSQAALTSTLIDLQKISIGSYLCYRTTQGLPGRIFLSAVDVDQGTLDIEFVTWVVP